MKSMICEKCGSNDFINQDEVFVCQFCGTKYSLEEAKKMMIEGTVDVKGIVEVDTSKELKNLYQIARRYKKDNIAEIAVKYYDKISFKDPTSWEACFYTVYFRAVQCRFVDIYHSATSVKNIINSVMKLIKENVSDHSEQETAYTEVATKVNSFVSSVYEATKNYYDNIENAQSHIYECFNNAYSALKCEYCMGDELDLLFGSDNKANELSVSAWKQGVSIHSQIVWMSKYEQTHIDMINSYVSKIKKYDKEYQEPKVNKKIKACYVATCVYGSYDCPQVWTLRRYRDNQLAKTWYGRAFIHTYYAISPTIVKWFGHTKWFKKMWQGKLDKLVEKLQNEGVESTPYQDRDW